MGWDFEILWAGLERGKRLEAVTKVYRIARDNSKFVSGETFRENIGFWEFVYGFGK